MKQHQNDSVANNLNGFDFLEIILVLSALDFNKNLYMGIKLGGIIDDNSSDGGTTCIHPGRRIDSEST